LAVFAVSINCYSINDYAVLCYGPVHENKIEFLSDHICIFGTYIWIYVVIFNPLLNLGYTDLIHIHFLMIPIPARGGFRRGTLGTGAPSLGKVLINLWFVIKIFLTYAYFWFVPPFQNFWICPCQPICYDPSSKNEILIPPKKYADPWIQSQHTLFSIYSKIRLLCMQCGKKCSCCSSYLTWERDGGKLCDKKIISFAVLNIT